MKILIFSLLFGLALCMPRVTENTDNNDHDEDHFVAVPASKVYGQAQQYKSSGGAGGRSSSSSRSSGGSRSSSTHGSRRSGGGSCSLQCMAQMKESIENDPEFSAFIEKQSKPYRFDNQFDARMLNKYCQKMNETVDCVAPCTDGHYKGMVNKALALPRYMCVQTRFTTYAPCYNRVGTKMEKICHAQNKCGRKKETLERNLSERPSTMADIEKMLKNTCDYMVCYSDCDRQKIIQECGADANRVLEGLYKKTIGVMEDMFSALGVPIEVPEQCRRVGSGYDDDGTTDIDDDGEEIGGHGSHGSHGGGSQGGRGNQGGDHGQGGRGNQGGDRGQGGRGQGQGSRGQGQGGHGSGGRGTGTRGGQRTTTPDSEYIDE